MVSLTTAAVEFSLLEISGQDSERLLQGQLTCDVTQLDDTAWAFGACCNAKGRMVANFMIARHDQTFVLRLPQAMLEPLKQHLGKYAVFYKVSLEASPLIRAIGQGNSSVNAFQWNDGQPIFSFEDGRQEQWNTSDRQPELDNPLTDRAWAKADIQAGIGWVMPESKEAWIPQHIGWHQLGGISFKKGCYTGQEVVARLQYLGKSKRQLVRIHSSDEVDLAPMSSVIHTESDKSVGELVSWIGTEGLAIVQGYTAGSALKLGETPLDHAEAVFEETEE